MTIFELERQLPNGFHDSQVSHIAIDYANRNVEIAIQIWVGDLESARPERETYRSASLRLEGIEYFAIDMPDPSYRYETDTLTIDVHDETLNSPQPKQQNAFRFRMFVSQYNAFVHCCASSATLTWQGDPFIMS